MRLLIKAYSLNSFSGAKPLIELAAIENVLKFDLIKGTALTGFHSITFHSNPECILVLDNITLADFVAVHFHNVSRI